MSGTREAIQKLLGDDDAETVHLVEAQLVRAGPPVLPDLEELLKTDQPVVSERVRGVIAEIHRRAADARLISFLREFGSSDRIEEACWLLSDAMLPGIDTAHYRGLLDAWGATLARRAAGAQNPADRIAAMRGLLCAELGFRGNTGDYYNPANSLLPCVIDTRLGIPITLSILFMRVGARAAIPVSGINLPGHFIARHDGLLFDPFHEARLLSPGDCAEILAQHHHTPNRRTLEPVAPRLLLLRMLTNLLYALEQREETAARQRVAGWIHALEPASPLGGR